MVPTMSRSLDLFGSYKSRQTNPLQSSLPACLRVHLTPRPSSNRRSICAPPSSSNGSQPDDSELWKKTAFPQYLHASVEGSDFCSMLEEAKTRQSSLAGAEQPPKGEHRADSSSVWRTIRREAEEDAKAEPLLSSFLYASILSHESFERSLAFVLANRLSDTTLLPTELFDMFYSVLRSQHSIADAALADLCAVRERDPACSSYSQALLYFKGYHAIQVQRIAHSLWKAGRRFMALALQSRTSEVLAVDVHPAAKIGKGVLLDHGTGVVIGETAEIGNNVSILQNVTLGGTGKEHGDRHPKVSDNVLIGASATILGNIRIGKGAQVAAGSLVLKPVPPKTMVAGSPAKEVGRVSGNPAKDMDQWTARGRIAGMGENGLAVNGDSAAAASLANGVAASAAPRLSPKPLRGTPADGAVLEAICGPEGAAAAVAAVSAAKSAREAAAVSAAEVAAELTAVKAAESGKIKVRKGAPPAMADPVEAVCSESAAKKKWGTQKGDIEYFL